MVPGSAVGEIQCSGMARPVSLGAVDGDPVDPVALAIAGSATTTADSTATDSGVCPVCPYPADAHDEIGARFCSATAAGKFERGCVCTATESTR